MGAPLVPFDLELLLILTRHWSSTGHAACCASFVVVQPDELNVDRALERQKVCGVSDHRDLSRHRLQIRCETALQAVVQRYRRFVKDDYLGENVGTSIEDVRNTRTLTQRSQVA
jgi:hypothetical protein